MLSKFSQTLLQPRSLSGCTPPAKNDVATVVTAPAASGLGACIQQSNLDASRSRVVKKGIRVSYNGFHFLVARVRLGTCWLVPVNAFGRLGHSSSLCRFCSQVRVVA